MLGTFGTGLEERAGGGELGGGTGLWESGGGLDRRRRAEGIGLEKGAGGAQRDWEEGSSGGSKERSGLWTLSDGACFSPRLPLVLRDLHFPSPSAQRSPCSALRSPSSARRCPLLVARRSACVHSLRSASCASSPRVTPAPLLASSELQTLPLRYARGARSRTHRSQRSLRSRCWRFALTPVVMMSTPSRPADSYLGLLFCMEDMAL